MSNIAILGSGNGSNAQALIDAVEAGRLPMQIRCILSDVKEARILDRARTHHIPAHFIDCAPSKSLLHQTAEAEVLELLTKYEIDYVLLAGFMRIIKQGLLDAYPNRIINIHPSLLPAFPGLDAGKQAYEAGVSTTGCTVHYVDAGIDTGEIIVQKEVAIEPHDSLEQLMEKIHAAEHIAYPEALRRILAH